MLEGSRGPVASRAAVRKAAHVGEAGRQRRAAIAWSASRYESNPKPSIPLLQPSKVVFAFDTARFYAFYVDLLTRPVPVHDDHDHAHGGGGR